MLYDRWRQIVAARRHELAVGDLASGRRWSFAELAAAAERFPLRPDPVVFPQGHTLDFVVHLLAGWRAGVCVCPLEPEQPRPALPPPPSWCAHVKGTSATASQGRWVAFRAEQLAADPTQIVSTMGLRPDWPNLGVISMAHSYGFSNLVLPLLLEGIPLILVPSPLPEVMRRAAAGFGALTLPAVPALWRAWHEAGAIPANVRLAISAGAPLPLPLEQAVHQQNGLKLHNFYGSSECGGIAYDRTPTPRGDAALAGTPLTGVSLALAGNGSLAVASASVAETYWPEPDPTLGAGTFQTSDLAELQGDTVLLRGRLGDVINVAGRKVAPEAVERALLLHPCVREVLVVGLPDRDGDRTDRVAAVVAASRPVVETELRSFLLQRLPAWQVPRQWEFVASLQPNGRGKVSRLEWRQRLLRAASSEATSTDDGL